MTAPKPVGEAARIAALMSYAVLDTAVEPGFDRIAALAARTLDMPIALVSLVDAERQWFKACVGLSTRETHRDHAFCAHAILSSDLLIVPDATVDPRFATNPLVTGPPHIRYYAGAPLITSEGFALGTLCVIDTRPRSLTDAQLATLSDLASIVVDELELRATANLRRMFEKITMASPDVIYLFDLETRRNVFASREAAVMLGYDAADRGGDLLPDMLHPDDLSRVVEHFSAFDGAQDNDRIELEYRVRRADGEYRSFLARETPFLRDASGRVTQLLGIATDITERVRAEEALARSEGSLRALIEGSPDAICVHSKGIVRYVNPALLRLVGRSAEEMLEKPVLEVLIHPDEHTHIRERMAALDAGEEAAPSIETSWCDRDGDSIAVEARAVTLNFDGDRCIVVVGRDVRERKRFEARLLVADRLGAVGTLAGGIAHEINNPLTAVVFNLGLLAETAAGALDSRGRDVTKALHEAREGAERIRKIVRGMMTFARTENERRTILDVRHVVDMALNMTFHEIRHRARLVKDLEPAPLVEADEARLGQVFINLLLNAAQAIDEGQPDLNSIHVLTGERDGRAFIEVRDTGGGIDPKHRGRIFDPFFTTKDVGQGTGLGLSICHGIVTALGGEITAAPNTPRGTVFCVLLPQASAVAPGPERSVPSSRAGDVRARLLIIDDDATIGRSLRRLLERDHDVTVVDCARDAISELERGTSFDVILCDLMMPQMTGMDLHARVAERWPDVVDRMVFMTGGAFTEVARRFLDRVPNERFDKPFDPQNLRALIRRMSSSRRPE